MKNKETIVILGGMGPQASTKLLEVLFAMCNRDLNAKKDSDFPEVLLDSVPVPNFISNKKNIPVVQNILIERISKLELFNPICFAIACNTAHVLLPALQENTTIPFISIINEVSKKVTESNIKKVGLLGTPVTIKSALYQNVLQKQNIEVIIPSKTDCQRVESVIRNVLAGKASTKNELLLISISGSLIKNGAEGIILGCTELPLIFPKVFPVPIFNSIEILAEALLKKYAGRKLRKILIDNKIKK